MVNEEGSDGFDCATEECGVEGDVSAAERNYSKTALEFG